MKKCIFYTPSLFLVFLLFIFPYFFSVSAQNTCTITVTPGNSIQTAINQANPGDVICVAPGTYNESIKFTRSGTATQPITVRAQNPNDKPVLDGQAGVSCNGGNCGLPMGVTGRCSPPEKGGTCFVWEAMVVINASHIIFDGFEITRSMGASLEAGDINTAVQNIVIKNNHIHHARHRNLVITNATNVKVQDNLIHHSGMFAPYTRGTELNWGANFSMINTNGADVRRNIIHSTWGEGIIFDGQDYNSKNIVIEDNILYDTWRGSINVHGADTVTINRNFVYQSDTANGTTFVPDSGMPFHAIVVRSTEPQDNFNHIMSKNVKVTNNLLVNRRHGVSINEIENVLIANNTILRCRESCIRQTINTSNNVRIINNIFDPSATFEPFEGNGVGITFQNNHWSRQPSTAAQGQGDIYRPLALQNNSFSLPAPQTPTFNEMRALANNYRLQANAPDINAGITLTEVTTDFYGTDRRLTGANDLGFYEDPNQQQTTTHPTPTTIPGSCPNKFKGDANCQTNPAGKSVDLLDYAIWYSEFIGDCSETNIAGCGSNIDGQGNAMDANFNFPGSGHLATDMRVNVFDYAVWIQGFVSQETGTTPTPTGILPTLTPTPTGVLPTVTRTPTPTNNVTVTPGAGAKVLFDDVVQFVATDKGFHTIKAAGSNPLGSLVNWQSPKDYYNGTWYFRYTITQADTTPLPGKFQVCLWNMPGYHPEMCAPQIAHTGGANTTYTVSQSPSLWYKKGGVPLDFTNSTPFLMRTVLRGIDGCNVTEYNVPGSCWNQWNNFDTMKFKLTIIMVPQGETFAGWQAYP